tara:strand:- start:168 stop:626 length:459 start_codon:yes stop_codon:yes gene_type:complete
VVEAAVEVQLVEVELEVYKYLNNLLMEIQLIQLQLVEEDLQDLMEVLVVKEIVHQLLVLPQKEVVLVPLVAQVQGDQEVQVVEDVFQVDQVVVELYVKEMMVEMVLQIQEDQDQQQIMVLEVVVGHLLLEMMVLEALLLLVQGVEMVELGHQ